MSPLSFKSILATALISGLVVLTPVAASDDTPPSLRVNGHAEVRVMPDQATISVAVEHRADRVDAAQAAAEKTVARVLALTDALAIPRQQVQTTQLTVRPDYEWVDEPRRRELRGYTVHRQMTIRLDELARLGELMTGVLSAGVNHVDPPVLDHSERKRFQREALAAAASDARAQAEALAQGLGVKVGQPLIVSTASAPRPRPMMSAMRMDAESGGAAADYETGELTIEATVEASFAIAQ